MTSTDTLAPAGTRHRDRDGRRPYYRLEGHFTGLVPIGPVQEGLRMNGHFEGRVVDGGPDVLGAELTGVDYFRVRADGVGVVDAQEVLTVGGRTVAAVVTGYVLPPEGLPVPSIEEMTRPDFSWPDAEHRIEAFATFSTAAPELAHLNRVAVVHTGRINFARGTITVIAHRVD